MTLYNPMTDRRTDRHAAVMSLNGRYTHGNDYGMACGMSHFYIRSISRDVIAAVIVVVEAIQFKSIRIRIRNVFLILPLMVAVCE